MSFITESSWLKILPGMIQTRLHSNSLGYLLSTLNYWKYQHFQNNYWYKKHGSFWSTLCGDNKWILSHYIPLKMWSKQCIWSHWNDATAYLVLSCSYLNYIIVVPKSANVCSLFVLGVFCFMAYCVSLDKPTTVTRVILLGWFGSTPCWSLLLWICCSFKLKFHLLLACPHLADVSSIFKMYYSQCVKFGKLCLCLV